LSALPGVVRRLLLRAEAADSRCNRSSAADEALTKGFSVERSAAVHFTESIMIDHVGYSVSDYARAKAFYEKALAPLGYALVMEATAQQTGQPAAGFGSGGKPDFWIGGEGKLEKPVHIAIVAKDRPTVDAFYRAALAAGGKDNGPPGLRVHYHPNYYGAFVLDPDGHNIEAVCHAPA
jgi:catechol 2,3-dioxygenase-like lactoylglutathione lyase family enzyme